MPNETASQIFMEDLAVGQRFLSRKLTVGADQIKSFAAEFDPQVFHLDEQAAETTFFGGLAASGWHTAALTMRLVVETAPFAGGVIGAGGELQWPKPTRPGDVLQVEIEVLELVPSRSRPDRGSGKMRIITCNQDGDAVQTFDVRVLLKRRV